MTWIDRHFLRPMELSALSGLDPGYILDLQRRGEFVPAKKRCYSPREAAHVLLLSQALACSIHLRKGPRSGKNRTVLNMLLKALDRYLDQVATSNQLPPAIYQVPRQGDMATTSFDLAQVATRILPLRSGKLGANVKP
jgi:hypothetical protein